MGAWGYTALESDQGLDVLDFVRAFVSTIKSEQVNLVLSELIDSMTKNGFFGETFENIDFYFDSSAMALAELILMFKNTGELDFIDEENQSRNLKTRVKSFATDKNSLEFLLRYLQDIRVEKPDESGQREIVTIWKETDSFESWRDHLDSLIAGLRTLS
jgi:Domain of unknown function (DUF4259)